MHDIEARISALYWQTPTILEIRLVRSDGRPFFAIQPGQYITVAFPDHPRLRGHRPFSIASAPTSQQELRLGIRVEGSYTRHLPTLIPGERVLVYGPFGRLIFDPAVDRRAVFLAGGIGITPFLGVFSKAADEQLDNQLILLFSNRSRAETPYQEELRQYARRNKNFSKYFFISDEPVKTAGEIRPGRITAEMVAAVTNNDFTGTTYFVCGPPGFMKAMLLTLRKLGVSDKLIRTEAFSVSPASFFEHGRIPRMMVAGSLAIAAVMFGVIVRTEQHRQQAISSALNPTSNVNHDLGSNNIGSLDNASRNVNALNLGPTGNNTSGTTTQTVTPTTPANNFVRPRTTVS
jgi:ferredoxin-NADP reductase